MTEKKDIVVPQTITPTATPVTQAQPNVAPADARPVHQSGENWKANLKAAFQHGVVHMFKDPQTNKMKAVQGDMGFSPFAQIRYYDQNGIFHANANIEVKVPKLESWWLTHRPMGFTYNRILESKTGQPLPTAKTTGEQGYQRGNYGMFFLFSNSSVRDEAYTHLTQLLPELESLGWLVKGEVAAKEIKELQDNESDFFNVNMNSQVDEYGRRVGAHWEDIIFLTIAPHPREGMYNVKQSLAVRARRAAQVQPQQGQITAPVAIPRTKVGF